MTEFTPVSSLLGGIMIGLASAMMLLFLGRIAGISGIVGSLLGRIQPGSGVAWRIAFTAGLIGAGIVAALVWPQSIRVDIPRSYGALILAGLAVGVGTRLGSGCTSGHGVCGISRFSKRSIIATCVFMFTGAATVFVVRTAFGGAV